MVRTCHIAINNTQNATFRSYFSAVIVGSVDGNRLWGKELNMPLRFVEWSPDSRFIMFVTLDAEVWIFDAEGAKVRSFTLVGQDHSSLGGDIGEFSFIEHWIHVHEWRE